MFRRKITVVRPRHLKALAPNSGSLASRSSLLTSQCRFFSSNVRSATTSFLWEKCPQSFSLRRGAEQNSLGCSCLLVHAMPKRWSSSGAGEGDKRNSMNAVEAESTLDPPIVELKKIHLGGSLKERMGDTSPMSAVAFEGCLPLSSEQMPLAPPEPESEVASAETSTSASSDVSSQAAASEEKEKNVLTEESTSSPPASTKTSAFPPLGVEEAVQYFSNLHPETRGTIRESLLIFNTLTGRMANDYSPTFKALTRMGFGINENRQLVVTDPERLNRIARDVRDGTTRMDDLKLPPTIKKKLSNVFLSSHLTDPADAIQQLIKIKINTIALTRYNSVVSANGQVASDEPSESSFLRQSLEDDNVVLNAEQERAIEIALRGHHLYIGGSAGTGKTVLLRSLCQRLQANRLRVAMTATTGVAGCHIGGCTFHHAFGISSHGDFIRRCGLLDYDVVIIDEVSMLSKVLFERFDTILREEAGTPNLPFGGVQIILCGDFMQLGCINRASIIHSNVFKKNFVKMRLQTIVRQSAFPEFAEDLQLMRRGIVPEKLTERIQQLPPGTMVPAAVNLLPTNKEVHQANEKEMERLGGIPCIFHPETGTTALRCESTATLLLRTTPGKFNAEEFSRHVRSLLMATLDLPRASLVSLYKMYEDGHALRVILPPGESVTWKDAMKDRLLEIAPLINEMDLEAVVTEIVPNADGLHTSESEEYLQRLMSKHPIAQPLMLKKGCRVLLRTNISTFLVNGSIGTVVDFVECKRENFPEYIQHENIEICIERYRVFCTTECAMPIPLVPVVQFHNGKTTAIPPWEFSVGGTPVTNYYSLSTVTIPLTLAYAFTVHKVQGLTLVGRVHLELSKMWPCEHLLYVAMSRVRNPDQLSLSSFKSSMIVANKDCVEFDNQLQEAASMTQEALKAYPVSSWKHCTDTIYHLRRRGSSLRSLMQQATLGGPTHLKPGALLNRANINVEGDGEQGVDSMSLSDEEKHELECRHQLEVGNSVIVARRMRKLIRHVERVAKLRSAREKSKNYDDIELPLGNAPDCAPVDVLKQLEEDETEEEKRPEIDHF